MGAGALLRNGVEEAYQRFSVSVCQRYSEGQRSYMTKQHIPILYTAAGGVVTDATGEQVLLLIRPSSDEVRLPKGHVEPGELPPQAALREVAEESGYTDLEIVTSLGQQLVAFPLGKRSIQRTEYYYLMQLRSRQQAERPAADEQFFPIWVSWQEALENLTFEAEREWVRRAQGHLKRSQKLKVEG